MRFGNKEWFNFLEKNTSFPRRPRNYIRLFAKFPCVKGSCSPFFINCSSKVFLNPINCFQRTHTYLHSQRVASADVRKGWLSTENRNMSLSVNQTRQISNIGHV